MEITPGNSNKNMTLWKTCTKCNAMFQEKDVMHNEECNLETVKFDWKHNFIKDNILFGFLNVYMELDDLSQKDAINKVFLSEESMQMCNISIGDPVFLFFKHAFVVKTAYSKNSNNQCLLSVSLLKSAIDLDELEGQVKLQKFTNPVYHADEITINYKEHLDIISSSKLILSLKLSNENRIITMSNNINLHCCCQSYVCKILDIKSSEVKRKKTCIEDRKLSSQFENPNPATKDVSDHLFYKVDYTTDWKIIRKIPRHKFKYKLDNIGGYKDCIKNIKLNIDVSTGVIGNFPLHLVYNGILLHGFPGVGKTMLAEAVLNERTDSLVIINISDIYNKLFSEIELTFKSKFNEAKTSPPGVIYIEDLDMIFKNKENDHSKKMMYLLSKLLDEIHGLPIAVLSTTSNLRDVDIMLRRNSRLGMELEIYSPRQDTRRQIIEKMLSQINHKLSERDLSQISSMTHGFVGADLHNLYCEATKNSIIRKKDQISDIEIELRLEDFIVALKTVKPWAMRGVTVEETNVRWEDIGGQEELKFKLKQAVEWPLNFPEIFGKFAIVPTKGVLMYGPPGCSKTMIAKALANESKLNFFNIKGSDLFSKWVGDSEKAVIEVFRKAKQVAPSIVFIDEIDAIGGKRGDTLHEGGSNVEERVLTELLTELDGVTELKNVIVVAATNRPDKIDPALIRCGRFNRIIYVPLPDAKTREDIFNVKLKNKPIDSSVDIKTLVERTEGYSGAEIQVICKEAVVDALEKNCMPDKVNMDNFNVALSIINPRTPNYLIELYKKFENCHFH